MNNKQKRIRLTEARQEARPKKFLTIFGWDILSDDRNWITRSEKENNRYFSTLENALWYISEQMEKGQKVKELKDVVKEIKHIKENFLDEIKALSTSLPSQG